MIQGLVFPKKGPVSYSHNEIVDQFSAVQYKILLHYHLIYNIVMVELVN